MATGESRCGTVGTGRALVRLDSGGRSGSEERPLAGFLVQLIANARRLPDFRQARRADPGAATERYGRRAVASVRTLDRVV